MATEVTRYINNSVAHTSGDGTTNGTGDGGTNSYASMQAFLTGYTAKDLVANDVNLTVSCEGGADVPTSTLCWAGWTTDSTRSITIKSNETRLRSLSKIWWSLAGSNR